MEAKILVTRPSMPSFQEYIERIKPLWDSHWLTNMGELHKQLEKELTEYLQVPFLSLIVNGHMALELVIAAMHFPIGSEVITTPFTFISTTHAIVRNGLKPIFCDIKNDDFTIDETKIEELITENTVAIVAVHVYGRVCNVEAIKEIAEKYNLKVIYDASHAFGVRYKNMGIGNFGNASTFSFHATKVYNTIEGGAVSFQSPELYTTLYNLKNFGIRSEEVVAEVGANAKMHEFSAAMGLCNLKHINEEIEKRKILVNLYKGFLDDIDGIELPKEQKDVISNYAYFPILVQKEKYGKDRDELYNILKQNNIYSRKYFYPLTSDQACFRNRYKKVHIQNARKVSSGILVLPLYADLSASDIEKISDIVRRGENE